jgi:hypothetical protein
MRSRSYPLGHGARGPILGAVVAVGLILDPGGLFPSSAQEAAPPAKGAVQKDRPSAEPTPEARLRVRKLKTRKAKAAYEIARLNHELAEIAVEEYREGTYTKDLTTVEGEIKLAEADRLRAEDRLDWADRMFKKGFVSKATLVSEQLSFEKAKYALEQAQTRKKVLVEYTQDKTIKELRAEVKKARDDELAKKAAWKREEAAEAELERQLDRT